MSMNDVVRDNDGYAVRGVTELQFNRLLRDAMHMITHRPNWAATAAAFAPPVVARGTTASKVKTTANTSYYTNGIARTLNATDDLWTLTGNTIAAGYVCKWQLCHDGTTATVRQSIAVKIADFASSTLALAACRWASTPPVGTAILGQLNLVNLTNDFIPGTTLLSAAGVTDTYRDGYDVDCGVANIVNQNAATVSAYAP